MENEMAIRQLEDLLAHCDKMAKDEEVPEESIWHKDCLALEKAISLLKNIESYKALKKGDAA